MRSPAQGAASHLLRNSLVWLGRHRSVAATIRRIPVTRDLASRFVAGDTVLEAFGVLERLRSTGAQTTVDILGEATEFADQARHTADRYIDVLEGLAERHLDLNCSLKLTALGLDIDQDLCVSELRRILTAAAALGAFVRIDMEEHSYTDRTLTIVRRMRHDFQNVGIVIQACLRRSAADVERLIEEGTPVRLCKGAYAEPATVAFPRKEDVDVNYVRLMERLMLSGNAIGIATHDASIIARAVELVRRDGTEDIAARCEFQMLFGVRRDLQATLIAEGRPVRVYVPFGPDWFPYLTRRLGEHPANVAFLLRSLWQEHR